MKANGYENNRLLSFVHIDSNIAIVSVWNRQQ